MDGDGDLSAFLAYLRANRGLSGNTVKAYGTDVRECLHALASRGIADLRQVTTDDLRGWMAFETRDHARSSMARKVVSVRSFFAWAHEHGRIEADPAAVLMTPKLPDTLPSVLTEAQAERLMDRADDDASLYAASSQRYETRHDEMPRLDSAHRGEGMSQRDEVVALRDAAMLELLYATGIRVAELVGLDIGDVDWPHRTIRVTGKGSKQRVVPFGDPAEPVRALSIRPRCSSACAAAASTSVSCAMSCIVPPARAGCPISARIRCGTARRRTCWTGERTCARFRRCSAIRRCALRSGTRMCRSSS